MKWGEHVFGRDETPSNPRSELAKVQRQISKLDSDKIVTGEELRGWALQKQAKKAVRRDPSFTYGKLSPAEKAAYQHKATVRVTRSLVARGIFETSVVLAGAYGVGKAPLAENAKRGAQISAILLAGKVGTTRVQEIRAVRTADKFNRFDTRRDELRKQLSIKVR